jgi:membrane protein YqaA with SNARE-associated domain
VKRRGFLGLAPALGALLGGVSGYALGSGIPELSAQPVPEPSKPLAPRVNIHIHGTLYNREQLEKVLAEIRRAAIKESFR